MAAAPRPQVHRRFPRKSPDKWVMISLSRKGLATRPASREQDGSKRRATDRPPRLAHECATVRARAGGLRSSRIGLRRTRVDHSRVWGLGAADCKSELDSQDFAGNIFDRNSRLPRRGLRRRATGARNRGARAGRSTTGPTAGRRLRFDNRNEIWIPCFRTAQTVTR